ncbi:GSCOCT00014310001.2-RA-CDS [Cotesia congregata]|uniref:Cc_ptp.q_1.10 n=2 Tax=root TaxID=1 RepID=S6D4W2_COTCN|nr:PTPQ [Bracoviriform congregatae]CAD6244252.1 GSCOCT00014310001.2-RA-CDS [Cotesia congregata]CAG17388.1 PTPQ [Bracoviriform congregatae]CAG26736.1 protein tyrosine phosphatase [Bracoviriform congregatae]CAG5093989.1 cc_ptp.q_1.10 [Cotesia congregata]CCQ71323.1 protein tyrosine phosphatase PTPQ [Cotesia congregata]
MGCGNSKALTRKGLIKFIENKNAAKLINQEHKDLMNEKEEGTFGASIATGYFGDCQNENEGLYFDHSRVVLQIENGSHTYINASYIDGFDYQDAYITMKTPLSRMAIFKFWWMVWEHQSESIVMLNTPKTDQNIYRIPYWHPEEGSSLQCGKLKITTSKFHLDHQNFELTKLIVTHEGGSSLYVNHYSYYNWQKDHILPRTSDFLDFMRMVSLYRYTTVTPVTCKGYKNPMIVHCSDGLERSMVFCAIDISISQIRKTGKLNLYSNVLKLRRDRYDCLKKVNYYLYCYLVLYFYVSFYM